jgi:hypothetical protein
MCSSAALGIVVQDKAWHRPLVDNMLAQDEQKIVGGKMMVPDSLWLHIGQRFSGAFAKAGAANASGFANHVVVVYGNQKLHSELVQNARRGATPVAACPCADQEPARRGGTIKKSVTDMGAARVF